MGEVAASPDPEADPNGRVAVLRGTLMLSASSAASVVVGAATAKACAVFLGPAGHGRLTLIQSATALMSLVAGCGLAVGLVRDGSAAVAEGNAGKFLTLHRAARAGAVVGLVVVGAAVA